MADDKHFGETDEHDGEGEPRVPQLIKGTLSMEGDRMALNVGSVTPIDLSGDVEPGTQPETGPYAPRPWEPSDLDRYTVEQQQDMWNDRQAGRFITYFQGVLAYLQTPGMANNISFELRAAITQKYALRRYRGLMPEEVEHFVTEAINGLPKAWELRHSKLSTNIEKLVACKTTLNQLRPALYRLRKELPRSRWTRTRWGAMRLAYRWLNT